MLMDGDRDASLTQALGTTGLVGAGPVFAYFLYRPLGRRCSPEHEAMLVGLGATAGASIVITLYDASRLRRWSDARGLCLPVVIHVGLLVGALDPVGCPAPSAHLEPAPGHTGGHDAKEPRLVPLLPGQERQ